MFKTASEIDQRWVIQLAADRQEHIDQAQSINVTFKATVDVKTLHEVHFQAWKRKLKTLYYCRSDKLYHGDSMNKSVVRVKLEEAPKQEAEDCLACQ